MTHRYGITSTAGSQPGKPYGVLDKHEHRIVGWFHTIAAARAHAKVLNSTPQPTITPEGLVRDGWLDPKNVLHPYRKEN